MTAKFYSIIALLFTIGCGQEQNILSVRVDHTIPSEKVSDDAQQISYGSALSLAYTSYQLTFSLDSNINTETLNIELANSPSELSVSKSGDSYLINGLPPGAHSLIVRAKNSEGTLLGSLVKTIIVDDKGQNLGTLHLSPLGTIKGRLKNLTTTNATIGLLGFKNHLFKINDKGYFYLTDIVPGSHWLEINDNGEQVVEQVFVESGLTTDLTSRSRSELVWKDVSTRFSRFRVAFTGVNEAVDYTTVSFLAFQLDEEWASNSFTLNSGFVGFHSALIYSPANGAGTLPWHATLEKDNSEFWRSSSGSYSGGVPANEAPYLELNLFYPLSLTGIQLFGCMGLGQSSPNLIEVYGSNNGVDWYLIAKNDSVIDTEYGIQLSF